MGDMQRRMRGRFAAAAAVGLLAAMTLAMPAGAADNGTVTGKVTVTPAGDAACITVGATLVDWGPLPLGGLGIAPDPRYEVFNCSPDTSAEIYVSGTDASGDLGAAWTLGPAPDTNVFAVNAVLDPFNGAAQISTSNSFVAGLPPQGVGVVDHELFMPVAASVGGDGEEMTFNITWTAVAVDPCADGCITYSGPVSSGINEPGELHRYEYTLAGGGNLTADLVFSHVDGDLDMHLRDAAGNLLFAGASTTDNETISAFLHDGTYYVDVFGFNLATNSYTLTITSSP